MASVNSLKLGETVSFDVYPAAILGTAFKRVKVMGVMDMESAKHLIDPIALHINVYPTLPAGTVDNPAQYYYVKVKLSNGQVTCVGLPWIREESIVVHQSTTLNLTIENVGVDDISRVVKALASNGYNAVDVKLV